MKELFSEYGGIKVSHNQRTNSYHVNCFLNRSFDFLLGKSVDCWGWVREKYPTSVAFITGYIDAEGNYTINQGRARFAITSYDADVLSWLSGWLSRNGIENKIRRLHRKGEKRKSDKYHNYSVWNEDLWRLNINYKDSLYRFIEITFPYIRHEKRKMDAFLCKRNIESRI